MPPSTLDYWVQIGLVKPSLRRSEGRRVERWWSITDVLVVRTIRTMRQAGASMKQVKRAKREIQQWGESFSSVRLFWDGRDIKVTDAYGTRSALERPGQQVLFLLSIPLDEWEVEVATDDEAVEVDLDEFRRLAKVRRRRQAARLIRTEGLLSS